MLTPVNFTLLITVIVLNDKKECEKKNFDS